MAEVGYLLGAGASAGCLPVVNGMAENALQLKKELRLLINKNQATISVKTGTQISAITNAFNRIIDKIGKICSEHSSIDTYFKKLFLKNGCDATDADYVKLKNEFSVYLTLVQILIKPDKRYDNFWASVLRRRDVPPGKIKIMSWNYDFQVEKSYCEFSGINDLNKVITKLPVSTPGRHDRKLDANSFQFIKWNGSARFRDDHNEYGYYYCDLPTSDTIANLVTLYIRYNEAKKEGNFGYIHELKFAWEDFPRNNLIESCSDVLNNIEILVIIGYTFPFFNRAIDEYLFEKMKNLKKIIIQDPRSDWVKERLLEIVKLPIETKSDLDQFFFPKELEI